MAGGGGEERGEERAGRFHKTATIDWPAWDVDRMREGRQWERMGGVEGRAKRREKGKGGEVRREGERKE